MMSHLKAFAALAMLCLTGFAFAQNLNLGGNTLQLKPESLQEELSAGRVVSAQLLGAARLLPNPALQRYVNLVGRRVAEQAGRKEITWSFGVVDSTALNAFAAPGGYILVTSALLQMLDTEDELAAVLGHEISHVVRKHHYRVIRKQQMLEFGAKAVSIGGDSGSIADGLSGMVANVLARGLDKSSEFEADRDGMVFAARAGYDASALIRVMEKLVNASKDESGKLLLSTHPSANERSITMAKAVNAELEKAAILSPAAPRLQRQLKN